MGSNVQCVILAGGRGTRMQSVTKNIPKSLIPVAGFPFIDYQLTWMYEQGIDKVLICIGHLGEQIQNHVKDGAPWKLPVEYADEGSVLKGTAGALREAADKNKLDAIRARIDEELVRLLK
jgi:NDP-sugar pyrophosphorylase family protein